MRYIKLNEYQLGLVFRNGAYYKLLEAGKYWVRRRDEVYVYDTLKAFWLPCDLNVLLKDEKLAAKLDVVTVREQEVVLLYENGLFKSVLATGVHIFWKSIIERAYRVYNITELYVPSEINVMLFATTELVNYIKVNTVESYEIGLLFVDGRFEAELKPGTYHFWKNTKQVVLLKTDTRQMQMEVNGQEILTADKANLRLNFIMQYKITDVQKAIVQNKEYEKQLYVLLQMAYREYIGKLRLDELLERKEAVSHLIGEAVSERMASLGITLICTGIRDIILPGDVKEIMNHVLIAEKKAQANIIMRREETASARSLLNTAKLMEDNQMLFRLKEMEYVEKIAEKINNISVASGSGVLDQFRQLFLAAK